MFLRTYFRFILKIIFKVLFHLEVCYAGRLPKKKGFVLVSNHASFLDPIILGVASTRFLSYAARDSLFRNILFGALLKNVGAFPIKRWSADLCAVREAVQRLKQGNGVLIFPEGTRSNDGQIQQDISHGFVLLAKKANVPIVPARIYGSDKALGKGSKWINITKIKVVFGDAVNVGEDKDYTRIANSVFEQVRQLKITGS